MNKSYEEIIADIEEAKKEIREFKNHLIEKAEQKEEDYLHLVLKYSIEWHNKKCIKKR